MFANNEEIKTTVGAQFHYANSSRSIAALLQGAGIALAALLLAPGAALADNECDPVGVDPSANGATADSYTCDDDYPDGVTYSSDGDLTLTATGNLDVGPVGFDLTGNGADSVDLIVTGNIEGDNAVAATDWIINLNTSANTTIEIQDGSIVRSGTTASINHGDTDEAVIQGEGAGDVVIDNSGGLFGRVDFSGLADGVTFNNLPTTNDLQESGWLVTDDLDGRSSALSTGDDVINNADGAFIQTSASGYINPGLLPVIPSPITTIDFGSGDDMFNNAGTLIAGTTRCSAAECTTRPSTTIFLNLEEFNNTGLILLGGGSANDFNGDRMSGETSDGFADDSLSMPGVAFTGGAGSHIQLDTDISNGGQTACIAEAIVSDCLNLSGGSTAGSTLLTVQTLVPDDRSMNGDIVLIDVSGGTSSADHFTLDPDSDFYSTKFGVPSIYKGDLFFYPFIYDESAQQHVLAATPSDNALQFPFLVEAAEAGWRTATANWSERQIARRDSAGIGGGVWIRATREEGDREAKQTQSGGGLTFEYDNSHELRTSALNIGVDLLSQSNADRTWALGGTVGYSRATADFDHSPNRGNFEGINIGFYGSYLAGDFFVDGILSGTRTELDFEMPGLGLVLGPDANTVKTDVNSVGAQIEGGWRWRTGLIGVEPLASLSYVRSDFDDANVPSGDRSRPGNVIDFGDNTSLRGGLGVRLTLDTNLGGLPTTWNLTGRALKEFDEESEVTIKSLGPDAKVVSEFDDMLTEVSGGVSVHSAGGAASAYLNADFQSSDTYDSEGVSAGFRYQW